MSGTFADTSFCVALLSERDQHHEFARHIAADWFEPVVTTECVLLELGNWFAASRKRADFVDLIETLKRSPLTTIVPSSRELFQAGLDLYARRLDKEWSLTDCISFVVMNDRRLTRALTADRHFEQAGFDILLK